MLAIINKGIENVKVMNRPRLDGIQYIFRLENGYGASVVRFSGSYGYEEGLWELAVIRFIDDTMTNYNLDYDTDITPDTLGYLSEEDVAEVLKQIAEL